MLTIIQSYLYLQYYHGAAHGTAHRGPIYQKSMKISIEGKTNHAVLINTYVWVGL